MKRIGFNKTVLGYDFEVSKEDLLLEAEKHKIISKYLQTNTESVVEVLC